MTISRKIVTIQFAGFRVRFEFPTEIIIPVEFTEFLCDAQEEADMEYKIQLLEKPLNIKGEPDAVYRGIQLYQQDGNWLRIYSSLTAEDGCQVACFVYQQDKGILYYPASKWDYYAEEIHCLHLIGIETFLLQKSAFLLHSSVVKIDGWAVLFSGPSGIGKSTQAMLWEKYLNAEILNGDRCLIRKKEDGFWGCGSPWCGTSGIYRKEQAPLKGIFVLQQSERNTVRKIGTAGFAKLFQQTIVNAWDKKFVEKFTDLLIELVAEIPVYELECRPDKEAVELAYSTLFEGGI